MNIEFTVEEKTKDGTVSKDMNLNDIVQTLENNQAEGQIKFIRDLTRLQKLIPDIQTNEEFNVLKKMSESLQSQLISDGLTELLK